MAHALLLLVGLLLLRRALQPEHTFARVAAVVLLLFYTLRYYGWRVFQTVPPADLAPAHLWQWLFFGVESLAIVFICWSAFALIRRSDHSALADARERELRSRSIAPKVTILIPTVNEPSEVVEPAIRAAVAIDYPNKEVVVCDDDKGTEKRVHAFLPELCARYGARYLRRSDSKGFKAGNLNYGLANTDGEIILVLDADFRATRNMLWRMIGLLDERVALVQTPQHYYSSDPIQHNLGGDNAWTEEQRHFFDIVLPSRDAWGNAACVGTGFVVRRAALGPGGFEEGCLSEDVYLGYALMSRGYQVRYLNERLSFGAAADSLSEYIRQRVRWCQGIIQATWLPYGPFRAPGLRLLDRLFYLEMPLYWVSQFGFLAMLLLAPLVYFLTGVPAIAGSFDDAVSYVVPRVVVASVVGYWISGGRVMPVVTEIKKLVCVFYILMAIASLAVNPLGKPFKPTLKGEKRDRLNVHINVLMPFLVLALATGAALLWNLLGDGPVVWDEYFPANVALALYVLTLLLLTCRACCDRPKDTLASNYDQTVEGSWLLALRALVRLPALVLVLAAALTFGGCSDSASGTTATVVAESDRGQAQVASDEGASHCVAFSAYVEGYSPNDGLHPGHAVIDALLDDIVARTDFRCLMTFGLLHGQDYVLNAARARGLKVIAILWLDGSKEVDEASIAIGTRKASEYRDTILRVACGSELRVRHGGAAAESIIGNCVSTLRSAGVTQPIGTNDAWWYWCDEAWPCRPWALGSRLDWIGVNVYAWFENRYSGLFPCVPAAEAAAFHVARLQDVITTYPRQQVLLTEFGWPAGPEGFSEVNRFSGQRCGVASVTNQRAVVDGTLNELRRLNLPYVVFSAFREPWKVVEGPHGPWWGLREMPSALRPR